MLKKIISHANGVEIKAGEGVEVEYASNAQSDTNGSGNEGNSGEKGNVADGGDATDHGNTANGGNTADSGNTANGGNTENKAGTENTTGTENIAGTGNGGEGESLDGSDGTKSVQGSDDAEKNASMGNQVMDGEGAGEDPGLGDFALEEDFLDNNAEAGSSENASGDTGIAQKETTENGMTESSMVESGMTEKPDDGRDKSWFNEIVLIVLACFALVAVIGGVFAWKDLKEKK